MKASMPAVNLRILLLAFFALVAPAAIVAEAASPTLVILPFSSSDIDPQDARTIEEIFRSKLVLSGLFTVVDRQDDAARVEEVELSLSAVGVGAATMAGGDSLGGEGTAVAYVLSGSLGKLGGSLSLTAQLTDVRVGKVLGSARTELRNLDETYGKMTAFIEDLVRTSLGIKNFELAAVTRGQSLEVGLGGLLFPSAGSMLPGACLSGGGYTQNGAFSIGYSFLASWHQVPSGGSGNPYTNSNFQYQRDASQVIAFGSMHFLFGDKVKGMAFDLGCGLGYDFNFGLNITPSVGLFYRNYFLRYYPNVNFPLGGLSGGPILAHGFIFGRSFFFGTVGKPPRAFE